jgi:predicted dehydrogenase
MKTSNVTRRVFLKTTAAIAVPSIVPASVFGQNAPSNRIHLAAIGVGNRGGGNVTHGFVRAQPDVRVVVACDCFKSRREKFAAQTNDFYKAKVCEPMADWREVLARDDVDGVVVSTPDHWHVPLAYALGFIAGWGAHPLDIAQWGLDMDHTGPVKYEGTGEIPSGGLFDTIDSWDIHCEYPNGIPMHFMCTRVAEKVAGKMDQRKRPFSDHGTTFWGTDGWISVKRGGLYASSKELQRAKIKNTETPVYRSTSHARNFVECMRTRKPTINPLETAIRSDTISHMSDICIRLGRPIQWDPKAERIVGDAEATKMLDRPMRAPYTI